MHLALKLLPAAAYQRQNGQLNTCIEGKKCSRSLEKQQFVYYLGQANFPRLRSLCLMLPF